MNKIQYMYQSINVYIDTLLRRLLQQIFFFLRSWVHVKNTFYYYSHFIYVVMCSISDGGYHCLIY